MTTSPDILALKAALEEAHDALPKCGEPEHVDTSISVGSLRTILAALEAALADAERLSWLLDWLERNRLLSAKTCRPDSDAATGDWWVLQTPAVINGSSCDGYGKTELAAIDAARAGKP